MSHFVVVFVVVVVVVAVVIATAVLLHVIGTKLPFLKFLNFAHLSAESSMRS